MQVQILDTCNPQIVVSKKGTESHTEVQSSPQNTPVTPPTSTTTVTTEYPVGSFVAVYMEEYRDEIPTIGRVLSAQECPLEAENQLVEVEWWHGRYSTMWSICKRRVARQMVPWTEKIPHASILMPITFTKSNHLKKETVTRLKQAYSEII